MQKVILNIERVVPGLKWGLKWGLASLLLVSGSVWAASVAVKADRLIDVVSGKIIAHPVVLIEGERIRAVGSNLSIPEGARVIELPGLTLVPGLIDAHVHIAGGGGPQGIARGAYRGAANARKTLEAGFTTVRSMGGANYSGVALRDAIRDGDVIGPRIFDAGGMVSVTGGHGGQLRGPDDASRSSGTGDTPEEFVRIVRERIAQGADFIKVSITGGFMSGTHPGQLYFTEAELRAIVETAHQLGKKVAVHAHGASGVRLAAKVGADSIEHAWLIDDEGIRLVKKSKHTVVVPTIVAYRKAQLRALGPNATPSTVQAVETLLPVFRQNLARAIKAGVPVVYGSDGPPGENGAEFGYLVAAGLTPLQALQSATVRAAEFIGVAEDIGSVSVGKYADLVALANDPLADVAEFERVQWVMKGGVVYRDRNASSP